MNRTLRTPLTAAALAAVLLGLTACGSTARVDKAGTVSHPVTVITLQLPDGTEPDGIYFAQDVARRSGGTLKVDINPTTYASTVPANEAKLVAALRAGRVGFSYQQARRLGRRRAGRIPGTRHAIPGDIRSRPPRNSPPARWPGRCCASWHHWAWWDWG